MVKNRLPMQGTKIPHAAGQLSRRATAIELEHLSERAPVPQNYRGHAPWSLCATTRKEKTCMPQLGRSPRSATKTRHSQKIKKENKLKRKKKTFTTATKHIMFLGISNQQCKTYMEYVKNFIVTHKYDLDKWRNRACSWNFKKSH